MTASDAAEMPFEQMLCRGLTGHQWNWKRNTAERFGSTRVLVRFPCEQCGKVASILMNMQGELLRSRQYKDPDGWVQQKGLNTVAGRAGLRAQIIPRLLAESEVQPE